MKTVMRFGCRAAWAAILAAAVLPAGADQLIMKDGRVMDAKSVRYRPSTQEYIVMTDASTVPIKAALVDRAVVPKPAALDGLAAAVQAGKHDSALEPLKAMIIEMQGLEWDFVARDLLGQALMGKKDFRGAVAAYKEILEGLPAARVPLAWRRHYWEALKGAERYTELKTDLDKTIAEASRETAALAQLMRGDMYLAQGQRNEALYDYLRTHILYEKVTELQPEALFKAITVLVSLNEPQKAAELKKILIEEHGNSPFARKLAGN